MWRGTATPSPQLNRRIEPWQQCTQTQPKVDGKLPIANQLLCSYLASHSLSKFLGTYCRTHDYTVGTSLYDTKCRILAWRTQPWITRQLATSQTNRINGNSGNDWNQNGHQARVGLPTPWKHPGSTLERSIRILVPMRRPRRRLRLHWLAEGRRAQHML